MRERRLAPASSRIAAALASVVALAACGSEVTTSTGGVVEAADPTTTAAGPSSAVSAGSGGAGTGTSGVGASGTAEGGASTLDCVSVRDCPLPDSDCVLAACDQGVCVTVDVPVGTPAGVQTVGDCLQSVCDGAGGIQQVPADDPKGNGAECTIDFCTRGMLDTYAKPAGTACSEGGGKMCDGQGLCVQCLVAADCPSSFCVTFTCVVAACADAVKNGAETDIDCGGPECVPCSLGQSCVVPSDCLSGQCTAGVCG